MKLGKGGILALSCLSFHFQDSVDFTWVKCYSSHALEQSPLFLGGLYVLDICLLIVQSR